MKVKDLFCCLFSPSTDHIESSSTQNGRTYSCIHYPISQITQLFQSCINMLCAIFSGTWLSICSRQKIVTQQEANDPKTKNHASKVEEIANQTLKSNELKEPTESKDITPSSSSQVEQTHAKPQMTVEKITPLIDIKAFFKLFEETFLDHSKILEYFKNKTDDFFEQWAFEIFKEEKPELLNIIIKPLVDIVERDADLKKKIISSLIHQSKDVEFLYYSLSEYDVKYFLLQEIVDWQLELLVNKIASLSPSTLETHSMRGQVSVRVNKFWDLIYLIFDKDSRLIQSKKESLYTIIFNLEAGKILFSELRDSIQFDSAFNTFRIELSLFFIKKALLLPDDIAEKNKEEEIVNGFKFLYLNMPQGTSDEFAHIGSELANWLVSLPSETIAKKVPLLFQSLLTTDDFHFRRALFMNHFLSRLLTDFNESVVDVVFKTFWHHKQSFDVGHYGPKWLSQINDVNKYRVVFNAIPKSLTDVDLKNILDLLILGSGHMSAPRKVSIDVNQMKEIHNACTDSRILTMIQDYSKRRYSRPVEYEPI